MLTVKNISFSYFENPILENISFEIKKGQQIALIGESGCGKSTLLKLLYGIYNLDQGEIICKEKLILGPKFNLIPGENYIKYLAQDFDLMPYISVEENVGKFLSNTNKTAKEKRVFELLEMVEMTEFAKVKAKFLSGGQQQRVALARVLALEPEILLLDEPFSQIDVSRKNSLQRNLFRYFKEKEMTCIIATHDSKEALSFADEFIVLQNGKLIVQENSKELYQNPPNFYTASLFGEVKEFQEATSKKTNYIYPHQLKVSKNGNIKAIVKQSYFKGSHYLIEVVFEEKTLFFEHETSLEANQIVQLIVYNE